MSKYLSKYYCGNKTGLCNYNEPLSYSKVLDRQFDNEVLRRREECKENNGLLGYCCDKNNTNIMNEESMEKINKEFNEDVFTKNNLGEFDYGQIPLVKVNKDENGNILNMEICTCGGDPTEFNYCVKHNCKGFKKPTEYEYCKLGSEHNKIGCFLNSDYQDLSNMSPSPSPSQSNTPVGNNNDILNRCKLHMVNNRDSSIEGTTLTINNLQNDCFNEVCRKNEDILKLRNLIHSTTTDETKYFNLGDSISSYGYLSQKEDINRKKIPSNYSIEQILKK